MTNVIQFQFDTHSVRTIADDNGEPWFLASDVCAVLGYRNPSKTIGDHCRAGGITKRDTPTSSGIQEMTFINEGNLYRLIVKSRKPEAERFEQLVMEEILPSIRKTGSYNAPTKRQPKALPHGLSHDQQASIKALVKARVEALPESKQAKAAITCWSALKSKFGCTYKEIAPEQFTEAVSLVARLPLEGELLEAEQPKPLELHYPASWLPEHNPHAYPFGYQPQGQDPRIHITANALCGMDARSPSRALFAELTRAGYDVDACKLEVLAMQHHLERYGQLCRSLQQSLDVSMHNGITFKLTDAGRSLR